MKVTIRPTQYVDDEDDVTITVSSDGGVGPDLTINALGVSDLEVCLSAAEAQMLAHMLATVS